MSNLPPEIRSALNEVYGPIQAEFTINQIPAGAAPDHIKEQWIGIPLPVRERNLAQVAFGTLEDFDHLSSSMSRIDNPIGIPGIEAVDALAQAQKIEAVNFWTPYQAGLFVFQGHEGELIPIKK